MIWRLNGDDREKLKLVDSSSNVIVVPSPLLGDRPELRPRQKFPVDCYPQYLQVRDERKELDRGGCHCYGAHREH